MEESDDFLESLQLPKLTVERFFGVHDHHFEFELNFGFYSWTWLVSTGDDLERALGHNGLHGSYPMCFARKSNDGVRDASLVVEAEIPLSVFEELSRKTDEWIKENGEGDLPLNFVRPIPGYLKDVASLPLALLTE